MLRLVTIVTLVVSLAAAPALAKPKRSFEAMDTDHDGWVSYEEVIAVYPTVEEDSFAVYDKDRDGVLDKKEWRRFVPK